MPVDSENVGIAFALVILAGGATAIGAAVVFFPALVKLASRRVLAGALGISAGVMTYVSFVEIFGKAQGSFGDAGYEEREAYLYSTLCFFGGVVVMLLIDVLVKALSPKGHGHDHGVQNDSGSHGSDPVAELDELNRQADAVAEGEFASKDEKDVEESKEMTEEQRKLSQMGINTAIAIGLHNFPEGLATFVATLGDPAVGAVLAIAIGIHNIPEGLCVALPIYYATGNRVKAFLWALVSGASEPIAALLGWAILANNFSDELYAILFGFVGGMMVIISTRELLPTAHRYDPEDTVVTYSFIGGMFIMALSLVLFVL